MKADRRVLLLGGTGMLGHRLANGLLARGHKVIVGVRRLPNSTNAVATMPAFSCAKQLIDGLDALDHQSMSKIVLEIKPDVIINCIGVIKQKSAGKESVPCIAINALLPHALEDAAARLGAMLIHFSTDCVFNGDRGHYRETDAPDANDLYGRTKAMGEVTGPHALTLRTSIIGPEIANFSSLIEWYLAHSAGRIRGFDRAIYSGLTTREMVNVVDHVITNVPNLRGLYQVASLPISKYDLLVKLRDKIGLVTHIDRDKDFVLDRSMHGGRFSTDSGYSMPDWDTMINGLVEDLALYWNRGWSTSPPKEAFHLSDYKRWSKEVMF